MRPIFVLAGVIALAILFFCFVNVVSLAQSETDENIRGNYVYGGNTLSISTYTASYGGSEVRVRDMGNNVFYLSADNSSFPSGKYTLNGNNLIGDNNGVTFLRR